MRVSVIIPTYNSGPLVVEAVESRRDRRKRSSSSMTVRRTIRRRAWHPLRIAFELFGKSMAAWPRHGTRGCGRAAET